MATEVINDALIYVNESGEHRASAPVRIVGSTGGDISTDSPLPVVAGHNTTGLGHGVKTVTTAGTDVVIAADTPAKWVEVQAQTDNTGLIAVGGSGVDATVATGTGVILSAGERLTLLIDNLTDVYVDATVSGDGIRFTYGV